MLWRILKNDLWMRDHHRYFCIRLPTRSSHLDEKKRICRTLVIVLCYSLKVEMDKIYERCSAVRAYVKISFLAGFR